MRGARLKKRSVTESVAWLDFCASSAFAIFLRVPHILVESFKRCSATSSLQDAAGRQNKQPSFMVGELLLQYASECLGKPAVLQDCNAYIEQIHPYYTSLLCIRCF